MSKNKNLLYPHGCLTRDAMSLVADLEGTFHSDCLVKGRDHLIIPLDDDNVRKFSLRLFLLDVIEVRNCMMMMEWLLSRERTGRDLCYLFAFLSDKS